MPPYQLESLESRLITFLGKSIYFFIFSSSAEFLSINVKNLEFSVHASQSFSSLLKISDLAVDELQDRTIPCFLYINEEKDIVSRGWCSLSLFRKKGAD